MTKKQTQIRNEDRGYNRNDLSSLERIFVLFLPNSRSFFSNPAEKFFLLTKTFLCLIVLLFWGGILCLTGCGNDKNSPPSTSPVKSADTPQSGSETTSLNADKNSPNAAAVQIRKGRQNSELPPLKKTPGLTADELIRKMASVYSKCKVYSDDAYFEILYDRTGPNAKEKQARRYPCSVTLKKPNQIHLSVRDGELFSDGKFLRSRIHLPAFEDLYREQKAPFLFTSVMEFYPDIRLASAMQLDVPPSICWAPPQLIFLLVKKPLKTFLPSGAEMLLLEPAYARIKKNKNFSDKKNEESQNDQRLNDDKDIGEITIPCDRIQITSDSGKTTFWISRKDNVLVRMEFPLEQLAVPDNVNRISKINLEIPDPLVSNDLKAFQNDEIFTPPGLENLKKVNEFLPSEIVFLGKPFPSVKFKSLISGFSDIYTDKPNDKYRLIWIFDKKALESIQIDSFNNQSANPGNRLITEFSSVLTTFGEEPQLQIIPACIDPPEKFEDRLLLSGYANLNLATSVYRLLPDKTDKITLSQIPVPSFILLDNKGIVQRFYRPSINRFRFQIDMKNLLTKQDLFSEELSRYQNNLKIFQEILHQADLNDIYRTVNDFYPMEPEAKPQTEPQKMKLRKIWTFSRLNDPGNPIFVPAQKINDKTAHNVIEHSIKQSANDPSADSKTSPAGTEKSDLTKISTAPQPDSVSTSTPPKRSWRDFTHSDLLLIPSDGNSINILSLDGKVLKTLESTITGDEPITFIRFTETAEGKRFYAASALMETQKIHCFNEDFEKITTINIGTLHNQRVADLLLEDIAGNSEPELLLALCGDSTDNTTPIDGIYAVDLRSRNILWKDEEVNTPYRIAIETLPDGKKNLLALNHYEGILGNIIIDDLATGKRRGTIPSDKNPAKKNNSILWLGNTSSENPKEFSVFMDQLDIAKSFFAGISAEDGQVLWQTPLTEKNLDRRMERIVSGDINGDKKNEWIIPYRDGTILFLDQKGKLLDKFQVGREITGVCVARTNQPIELDFPADSSTVPPLPLNPNSESTKKDPKNTSNSDSKKTSILLEAPTTLLIITDVESVTAWKVDW